MARYVDGFLIPLRRKDVEKYRKIARLAGRVWREHGALEYFECLGDDLSPKGVAMTFPRRVRARPGETVVFSWIVYRSRAHRDRVNARVMKDPRITRIMAGAVPFDGKRMSYGGFTVMVRA
jgi:uncharacterized protein YbaA (DUF1428 family)